MELLRCAVCGEPVYTSDFQETLSERVDYDIEPLCALHRQNLSFMTWKRLAPDKGEKKETKDDRRQAQAHAGDR